MAALHAGKCSLRNVLALIAVLAIPAQSWAQTSTSPAYAVMSSATSVLPGATVTVTWRAPSTHASQDWVGLFLASMPSTGNTKMALKWVPAGTSGAMSFTMPQTEVPQVFEFRYLLNGGYTEAARSGAITVSRSAAPAPASPTTNSAPSQQPLPPASTSSSPSTPSTATSYKLTANPITVAPGGLITVVWQAPSNHSSQDWVGLFLAFKQSAGNTKMALKWVPAGTTGTMTFVAPNTLIPQTYQLRYLLNGGFTEAASSTIITVKNASNSTSASSTTTPTQPTTTSSGAPVTNPPSTTTPPPSVNLTPSAGSNSCPDNLQPAFQGAEGFGRCSQGGRGGRIIDVTNLSSNGSGSLRQCAEVESGPRTCRMTIPGTISLGGYDIVIRNDFLTIDGSAASVALKDGGLDVRANHTIIRHLRVRPGAKSWVERGVNANGIVYRSTETGAGTHDHICDHCSISWGTDDLVAIINGTYNVTIQDSILSEGLTSGPGCNNCGSRGLLIGTGNKETVSVIRTLNAHNFIRFPNATGGQIDFVNNVDYNGNGSSAQIVPYYAPVKINMVGNYWKDGPSAIPFNLTYNVIRTMGAMNFSAQSGIYVQDNVGRSRPNGTSPETNIIWGDNGGIPVQAARYPFPSVTTVGALQAYEDVLNHSGAQPRDAVDARVTSEVRNGTGSRISDPSSVGGWPVLSAGTP